MADDAPEITGYAAIGADQELSRNVQYLIKRDQESRPRI